MGYRELLDLYKNGRLDGSVKEQIEADIEKQEAISEYLFEQEEAISANLFEQEKDAGNGMAGMPSDAAKSGCRQEQPDFARMVNRSIRRAFLRMWAAAAAFALAGVLLVLFVLPKAVSSFYYNPGAPSGESGNQMSLDLQVYTEMRLPGYNRDTVIVQDRGYGNYDIQIQQWYSLNRTVTNLSGRISRGNLTLYDPNLLNPPAGNVFAWFQINGDSSDSLTELIDRQHQTNSCAAGSREDAAKLLHVLDEDAFYVAYVTLDKMMPYETFIQYVNGLGDSRRLGYLWCATCTENGIAGVKSGENTPMESRFQAKNLGFSCDLNASHFLDWDREAYPQLVLWDNDTMEQGLGDEQEKALQTEAFAKTHFTSMLRYLDGQKDFLKMMGETYDYGRAAEYVEKNGLMIYGFAGVGSKETLLQLIKEPSVYEIYTQKLR